MRGFINIAALAAMSAAPVFGHSRALLPSGDAPGYRSRGPQAKPRRRSNRLHISRRVRRKHRRAK